MFLKIFEYRIEDDDDERELPSAYHADLFKRSKGPDRRGEFARYRGKSDAILMKVRTRSDYITGLIGKHSTERDVTVYEASSDEAEIRVVQDNDYPHAPFICFPQYRIIICSDRSIMPARTAMKRLHAIFAHRTKTLFQAYAVRQADDLRFAVNRFRVVEVSFEILPVNPHTGDLGAQLDESRKKDQIKRVVGRAIGTKSNPLKLNGGFLTQVQQLQQSGHSRVGYTAFTREGLELKLPKPTKPRPLDVDEDEEINDRPELRVRVADLEFSYPFTEDEIRTFRKLAMAFRSGTSETDPGR